MAAQYDLTGIYQAAQSTPDYGSIIQNAMSISDMLDQRKLRGMQMQQEQQLAPLQMQKAQAEVDILGEQKNKFIADNKKELQAAMQQQMEWAGKIVNDIDTTTQGWKENYAARVPVARAMGIGNDIIPDPENVTPENLSAAKNFLLKFKANTVGQDKTFTQESTLRKEFGDLSKDFIKIRDAYKRIEGVAKKPTPAGDLALIFNYMKLLDPGSTVREGEFANAENSGSAWNKVGSIYNKIVSGQRLTVPQRADFLSQSKNLFDSQKTGFEAVKKNYKSIAERGGLDPENIIGGFDYSAAPIQQGTPTAISGPTQPQTQEEYDAIPSGAEYIDGDGSIKRKK